MSGIVVVILKIALIPIGVGLGAWLETVLRR